MYNLASKSVVGEVREAQSSFRKHVLAQLVNQNYSQAKQYKQSKDAAINVSARLFRLARGCFIEHAPDNFDQLTRTEKSEIGREIYNHFSVELDTAETKFAANHSEEHMKELKVFEKGGNWANTRSKIKVALEFGLNLASTDEHGGWKFTTISGMASAMKIEEAEEQYQRQQSIRQDKEAEYIKTAAGRIQYKKTMIKDKFCAYIDAAGEGLQPEQALKRIEALEKSLEESLFAKIGKNLITRGLAGEKVAEQIKARFQKERADFEAKLKNEGDDDDGDEVPTLFEDDGVSDEFADEVINS